MQSSTGVLYQQNAGIMEISRTTQVSNIKPNLHAHSGVQFVWLENFSGDFQVDEVVSQASSSDICIFGNQIPHRLISHAPQIYAVNFLLEKEYFRDTLLRANCTGSFSLKCEFLMENIESLRNMNVLHTDKYERDALKHLTSAMMTECCLMREGYDVVLNGMIREFLIRLIRSIPNRTIDCWHTVQDVCKYLSENMAEPFDLTRIAGEFGFNKSHLCRLFRKIQNKTMYEYLIDIRCERALELMKDENRSITEISQDVGFTDYAQFWRCFKQYTGVTPNKYRSADAAGAPSTQPTS